MALDLHDAQSDALLRSAGELFEKLRILSFDGVGITREAFGSGETAAHVLVEEYALKAGLDVTRDRAGNLYVTLPGHAAQPFIATGSHLDSVPRGGNYDGAAGVVAGVVVLSALARQHIVPPRTIKLLVLRGEESAWFGRSWIGSRALFGLLTPEDLAQRRTDTGRPLREYLADTGADVAAIETQQLLLNPANVAAFLEVHIEQGPVLEAQNVPLGVVTGIYGNLRHRRIVCRGEAAHAGTTPRDLRRDAVVALADFIMRIDRRWADCLARGERLVVTHGMVGTNEREHAISRVPGEATTSLEIRADDKNALENFHQVIMNEANNISSERGVDFAFDTPIVNDPARMDAGWTRRLEELCEDSGIAHAQLPSGAGHDAAIFAHVGVPTAMLFIRNRHGSHNPRELMSIEDFVLATRVLMRALTLDADQTLRRGKEGPNA